MATGIKTGGRTAGTTNKTTAEVRKQFSLLLENNIDNLQSDIDSLKPAERIKLILDLAGFVIPKMKAVEVTQQEQQPIKPIIIDMSKWK